MKKKQNRYCGYQHTRNERRANCEYREDGERVKWGRPSRSGGYLDPWNNERQHGLQKSWKMKREKQYNVGGRGKKHILKVSADFPWRKKRAFEDYCENHNIPYEIRHLNHTEVRFQYYCWDTIFTRDSDGNLHLEHVKTKLEVPRKYKVSITDGYELIWWTNKDIGVQYIIQ